MTTDANSESDELEEPKTTRITFHNPEAKEIPEVYRRDQAARKHFEAALYIKRKLSTHRIPFFGKLIAAAVKCKKENHPTDLIRLCNILTDQEVEVVRSKNIELKEN
ncbi:hypothetical protein [Halobellus salinus]|nr:hypothetical protein [Halobellus salinus]